MIRFNKPHITGSEIEYIQDAIDRGRLSGNDKYTKLCQAFFEKQYGFKKALLTHSCTDALEMAAILLNIKPGDEVMMPSYTFVSTANAFILRGARVRFVDSREDHPGMDENKLEELVTERTKAIVPVHYAGVACDMDKINKLAARHNLSVVEDAAQSIDSYYKGKPLGAYGDLAAFSFHETKNIVSGEGGMLAVNNKAHLSRAEIIWEKGTNRSAFWRGEVDKYGWVDIGSSFLPSELVAAFLYAQLQQLKTIQQRRKKIWERYYNRLQVLQNTGDCKLPFIPEYASNNGHMFYLVCNTGDDRNELIRYLKDHNINAVFHYLGLHKSEFFKDKQDGRNLSNSDHYTNCLLRLPFYTGLTENQVDHICEKVIGFYKK